MPAMLVVPKASQTPPCIRSEARRGADHTVDHHPDIASQLASIICCPEIGILLPNNQRQHRTLQAPKDELPLRIVPVIFGTLPTR